ncbi:MAG TPA: plastocyanin/azurin family copper-binding protein [Gemmatimonadales bacterium]|nr:plastocyanin/azurin family copper-binding protein [Gemmatimonadales bacterium]
MNRFALTAIALPAALLAGCGDDDGAAPSEPLLAITKPPTGSGDQQVGIEGRTLPEDLRVIVTRGDQPAAGVTVTWQTPEGSLEVISGVTDASGSSSARWTLQRLFAQQVAFASISGAGGTAQVAFTALAGPDPEARNTVHVGVDGNRFEPAEVTIVAGDTVNWYWPPGSEGHNIVPDDGDLPPHSGAPDAYPRSHTFRFTAPGTYRYHCATHGGPGGMGMSGTVIVLPSQPDPLRRGR